MFLWLCHRPAAVARSCPLAGEIPYAVGGAKKRKKKKKKRMTKDDFTETNSPTSVCSNEWSRDSCPYEESPIKPF